ncbi:MAG: response regulator [Bacteriovoracaceae bacterium]
MEILISEDDESIRTVMKLLLTECNATVHTVSDGQEALELLESGKINFDVLITDFNMPRMNGDQLVKEVFERNIPLKKIIMISGRWDNSDDMEELMNQHSNIKCLFKPFTPDAIIKAVF